MEQLTETLTRTLGWTEGEKNLVAADPAHAAKPTNDQSLSLIGKVITDRELSMNFIRANVTRLLRPVRQIQIRGIAENMFVMKFEHPLDMKNALKGCPWVLDKHALILEPVDPAKNLADHKLTWLPLVTRVHQLSLANRSEQVARLIGDRLGRFVELPKLSESFYSPHFRIKILVDVTMPLKRGINFQGVDGKKEWLSVTYERLPIFCFLCGVIGHMEDKCPARYEEGFLEPEGAFPYGTWLRDVAERRGTMSYSGGGVSRGLLEHNHTQNPQRSTGKKGAAIFTFSSSAEHPSLFINNIQGGPGKGVASGVEKRWDLENLDDTGESSAARDGAVLRKITVPSHKRKAKEAALGDITNTGKKTQLLLRDEDSTPTAATVAEINELSILELPRHRAGLDSSWLRSLNPKVQARRGVSF